MVRGVGTDRPHGFARDSILPLPKCDARTAATGVDNSKTAKTEGTLLYTFETGDCGYRSL